MKSDTLLLVGVLASFVPFILFVLLNKKANLKQEFRYKQFALPAFALIYSAVLLIFLSRISSMLMKLVTTIANLLSGFGLGMIGNYIMELYNSWGVYLLLVVFNTAALLAYITVKGVVISFLKKLKVEQGTFIGSIVEIFYAYDEMDECWYIKDHFGQSRAFITIAYYGSCAVSCIALLISCVLCMNQMISVPFYPVFAIIIIGELAFFIDGLSKEEKKSDLSMQTDHSKHIVMYPLLRKPLRALFGDKLAAEGTTVNNGGQIGGSIEDILVDLEKEGGHVGKNYSAFIRRKMETGLKPNIDYVRSGYDLTIGKSLLFNTPFYDKLNPYMFYAMNRALLTGGKALIVLGRHGTEEDLRSWTLEGMQAVSNIPEMWKVAVLSGEKMEEDSMPDIGIISRSGVHDLDIHKNNLSFLKKVSFVLLIEPSRLVTTAQIGLNLLIKNCGAEDKITFCSVDRNCDGLVDALSHILMTNITEVNATEYPHGMSSYMYWTADGEYLQHRILPGVSRFLGMGTEFSMVALRNQVKKTVWYGGEVFPVKDVHWIAKQYYYDLLDYARLPNTQEVFDRYFEASFNMCNERVSNYSFITVEDDRNNLFEIRRNFATIAEQQGFVNVISSEYMLREYMSENMEIFTADAKAIPYITADYARTKRNTILSLCLLLCVDYVKEETLNRQMLMMNIDTKDPIAEIWKEICLIFGENSDPDLGVLTVKTPDGRVVSFDKDETILYKRIYSVESGKFENVYTIEDADFSRIILDDLQNASYIAEQESKDVYIGTELKGHVYQKYMPGQFFTLNGKYYEMISTATDNRILVRRASEHIDGRLSYRQVRDYKMHRLEDSKDMGALKSVNNINIYYQFADFSVDTPGYWRLGANNDFDNGDLVKVNGVPERVYHHKQVLKLDFSGLGEVFTDSVRMTLTNLLNEVFVTLFADNQPFISAVTPGSYNAPLTYSLELAEGLEDAEKCIFIIEDSQLDIGLLVAVERNISRILQIICDYLSWNEEQIAKSIAAQNAPAETTTPTEIDVYEEDPKEKVGFFRKIGNKIKEIFQKSFIGKIVSKIRNKINKGKETDENGMTPKQRKKAEKAAAKAAKKAAREQKKAENKEKRLQKRQKKAEEVIPEETTEVPAEETAEIPAEETAEEADAEAAETAEEDPELQGEDEVIAETEAEAADEADPTDTEETEAEEELPEEAEDSAEETEETDPELTEEESQGSQEEEEVREVE